MSDVDRPFAEFISPTHRITRTDEKNKVTAQWYDDVIEFLDQGQTIPQLP